MRKPGRPAVRVVSPDAELVLPGSIQAIQETAIQSSNGNVRRWLVGIDARITCLPGGKGRKSIASSTRHVRTDRDESRVRANDVGLLHFTWAASFARRLSNSPAVSNVPSHLRTPLRRIE
jgi:hypothetical protein